MSVFKILLLLGAVVLIYLAATLAKQYFQFNNTLFKLENKVDLVKSVGSPNGAYVAEVIRTRTLDDQLFGSQVLISCKNGSSGLMSNNGDGSDIHFEWRDNDHLLIKYPRKMDEKFHKREQWEKYKMLEQPEKIQMGDVKIFVEYEII